MKSTLRTATFGPSEERHDALHNLLPRPVFEREIVARALDAHELGLWDEFLDLVSLSKRNDLVRGALSEFRRMRQS